MATQVTLGSGVVDSAAGLKLRTNGSTEAVDISTGQVATLAQNPILTSGTANGVAYLNGSKVVTSGSALVFDGTNLGVGTSSPSQKLTVSGNGTFTGYLNTGGGGSGLRVDGVLIGDRDQNSNITLIGQSDPTLRIRTNSATVATFDSSGNLGLGVTPSAGSGRPNLEIGYGGTSIVGSQGDLSLSSSAYYAGGWKNGEATYKPANLDISDGVFTFRKGSAAAIGTAITWTTQAVLDASGNLLVGETTAADLSKGFSAVPGTGSCYATIGHASGTASGYSYLIFGYNSSNIGSITQNGTTGVLYNLTSDYRLKNNPEALTGAKEFVMALQPKKWQWWDGSGEGVGFIAHEFMEVAKYSGHGEKDAVDENGNIIPQSIQPSSSEVMANLVALLQEQQAIITQLQADVVDLTTQIAALKA